MSKTIIYGTTNPAKVSQVRDVLEPLGFRIKSLADFAITTSVEETGESAEENARLKAVGYAAMLGQPVLSMDVGLYFNDLPDDMQPGVHVRRIDKVSDASDDDLLEHYTRLAARMGNEIKAYWRYAFVLAKPTGEYTSLAGDAPRIFVSKPSPNRMPGYPLESLQVDPASGKYIADMNPEERAAFWQNTTGVTLRGFITENIAFF